MTRNARLRGLEKDLILAEKAYEAYLRAELQKCAAGYWGLFGINDSLLQYPSTVARSEGARELLTMGEAISELRSRLGFTEPFALHEKFVTYRRMAKDANAPGEPRLAQRFLEELAFLPTAVAEP